MTSLLIAEGWATLCRIASVGCSLTRCTPPWRSERRRVTPVVRPDMRYCSRSRCFHPDLGTKHISVPPRHMTKSYAPGFQHDITTLQIQGYNIPYNQHTTASNTIQQRKVHV